MPAQDHDRSATTSRGDGAEPDPPNPVSEVDDMLEAIGLESLDLFEQRRVLEAVAIPPPEGMLAERVVLDGVDCEWLHPLRPTSNTIVSFRGGGYCLGSLDSNRQFSSLLTDLVASHTLNVGYRNAPEHPFPSALEDVLRAYRALLDAGSEPATIAFAGNSAGGGLLLSALLSLRDSGDPLPACAVAVSPWTDLACTGASIRENEATDKMLSPASIRETALMYAVDEAGLINPYVSPLYGDPTGLPPLLIQVSGAEILRDDAVRFADRARTAGVDVTLEVVPGMPHVWHLFGALLPEAEESSIRLGLWLLDHLPEARS